MLLKVTSPRNTDNATCVECGGECCQQSPGETIPADWGSTREEIKANLTKALSSGRWAVDCWDGSYERNGRTLSDTDVFYVRPATTNSSRLIDRSWGGVCNFFSHKTGCSLSYEGRPFACRSLTPRIIDGKARCLYFWNDTSPTLPCESSKEHVVLQWLGYQSLLMEIVKNILANH